MGLSYAYSPLPDLADRSADFMLANVQAAIKARKEMGWICARPRMDLLVLPASTRPSTRHVWCFTMR